MPWGMVRPLALSCVEFHVETERCATRPLARQCRGIEIAFRQFWCVAILILSYFTHWNATGSTSKVFFKSCGRRLDGDQSSPGCHDSPFAWNRADAHFDNVFIWFECTITYDSTDDHHIVGYMYIINYHGQCLSLWGQCHGHVGIIIISSSDHHVLAIVLCVHQDQYHDYDYINIRVIGMQYSIYIYI